jgi:predicted DsbA family dithiol-disulfide isomerase
VGTVPVTLFADFTSIESYLTEVVLWGRGEEAGVKIACRACELPASLELPSFEEDFEMARRIARSLGLQIARPSGAPLTRKAHEAARLAAHHPREREFRLAIHAAYWRDDRDIGRIDVLQQLAAEAAFDPVELKIALDIDRFRDDVERDYHAARLLGVVRAPAVYIGKGPGARAIVGLIGAEQLEREFASYSR